MGASPSINGLSCFGGEITSNLPLLFLINHAQPLPNRPTPAAENFSLNWSNPPKAALISSASLPFGSPPAFGPMIFQTNEGLACPPPLLRTTVRMSSGTELQSRVKP